MWDYNGKVHAYNIGFWSASLDCEKYYIKGTAHKERKMTNEELEPVVPTYEIKMRLNDSMEGTREISIRREVVDKEYITWTELLTTFRDALGGLGYGFEDDVNDMFERLIAWEHDEAAFKKEVGENKKNKGKK